MNQITASCTYSEVMELGCFAAHKKAVEIASGVPRFLLKQKNIADIAKMLGAAWNPHSIAAGLDHLAKVASHDEAFYKVWPNDPAKADVELIAFPLEKRSPFVVICPGGAYMNVASAIEGFPTAKRLNELGYGAFVLRYRVLKQAKAPNPVDDLAQAVRLILKKADKFNVIPEHYAVMGFSAGGHLAACFGTESLGYAQYGLPKPGCMILAYPVITMGEHTHRWSRTNFLGRKGASNPALIQKWSAENQVTASYPPTFIWQCEKDNAVPIENSRLMVRALEAHGIETVYQTFDSDVHGWGSGEGTAAEGWIDRSVLFMKSKSDKGE